jgi:hypothetical protein
VSNYIPDGYTKDGYIAERLGVFDAVVFKFRPMLHLSLAEYNDKARISNVEGAKEMYRKLEKHVVSWDAKEAGGVIELKAAKIARLPPALIERLFNIVAGYQGNDEDPAKKVPTGDEFDSLLEDAGASDDAKNLQAA